MNHYCSLLFGIFFLVFSQVKCTGYLEVSFKSDFNLKSVLNVSSLNTNSSNSRLVPFLVSPNKTEKLSRIPIDFNETVIMTVFVINQDRLGMF
ncbi:hypothetical protein CRE_15802 [Caenorhabditis remanei]|uniref:Uncharacterized protein n=1 Tax=Caenorhabditis remanei TaxID=31234 RepID=E3NMV5_CAERE|nr:hypothetical protein CRE_15802 [Caenorhabditis remanei]